MALEDFLNQKSHTEAELKAALNVILTFKDCESNEEFFSDLFLTWAKLELLEDYLKDMTREK